MRQLIIARKDLQMSPGKLAAQVSHASMAFLTTQIRKNARKVNTKQVWIYSGWLDVEQIVNTTLKDKRKSGIIRKDTEQVHQDFEGSKGTPKAGRMVSRMVYTIQQIQDITAPIAAAHGIRSVHLFGSYARGEATDDSDIDLRIDTDTVLSLFEIGGIYADLEDGLQKELDLVTTRGTEEAFLERIKDDEVLLYEAG